MRIDCDSCPGRPTACAGCMMNVLITGASGLYAGETGESPPIAEQRADMLVAITQMMLARMPGDGEGSLQ